jgi:type II secretory pathway pseudopilin PulG
MRQVGTRHLGRHLPARRRSGDGGSRPAFTYVELLVALGIVTILAALLIPIVGRMQASARGLRCTTNLRQISLAFKHYAMDNNGRLPDPPALDLPWERVLLAYVGSAELYKCPADAEVAASLGSSYDWRDTGDALTTLAGAALSDGKPATVLVYDALPSWHAPGKMGAARVDGSAGLMNARDCLADVMTPLRSFSVSGSSSAKP